MMHRNQGSTGDRMEPDCHPGSHPDCHPEPDYSFRGYLKQFNWYRQMETRVLCFPNHLLSKLFLSSLLAAYFAYLVALILIDSDYQEEDFWCSGEGFFYILSGFVAVGILYFKILKPFLLKRISKKLSKNPFCQKWNSDFQKISCKWQFKLSLSFLVVGGIFAFLAYDANGEWSRLTPLIGLAIFIGLGVLFSAAPCKIVWRHVIWGLALQFCMGLLVLRWPPGRGGFECLANKISALLDTANESLAFVTQNFTEQYSIFAFRMMGIITFLSIIISGLLYHGILQWVVIKVGWVLQITVGTTACESVNAAANIFLSMVEGPMILQPFLKDMTKSELHAIFSGGFATISGSILTVFISFGVDPLHLMTASVMSAPAALAYSKLVYPETEVSKTAADNITIGRGNEVSTLHAIGEGLIVSLRMSAEATFCLLGCISLVAFIDAILNWACLLLDYEDGTCSTSALFGFVFMPLSLAMGVSWEDCFHVGQLIGTKTMINEFVAYVQLGKLIKKRVLQRRSEIIATYALCGFANFGSIGIMLGAVGSMAPTRKADLASIGFSSMMAGNVACFLTACVAGSLIPLDGSTEGLIGFHEGNSSVLVN